MLDVLILSAVPITSVYRSRREATSDHGFLPGAGRRGVSGGIEAPLKELPPHQPTYSMREAAATGAARERSQPRSFSANCAPARGVVTLRDGTVLPPCDPGRTEGDCFHYYMRRTVSARDREYQKPHSRHLARVPAHPSVERPFF